MVAGHADVCLLCGPGAGLTLLLDRRENCSLASWLLPRVLWGKGEEETGIKIILVA